MYSNQQKEISFLIDLKRYLNENLDNPAISRQNVLYFSDLKILIDKKLGDILSSKDLKSYLNYEELATVKKEVVERTNLMSKTNHPNNPNFNKYK
jgi:hypothetical protein